jgi:seryl-tRNA synthetase
MLNPELLRRDPDRTRAILARRDEDAVKAFDEAIVVDEEWRRTTAEVEALRAERKHRSATRRGRPSDEQVKEDRLLGERLSLLERELKVVEEKRKIALAWIPNLPDASVVPREAGGAPGHPGYGGGRTPRRGAVLRLEGRGRDAAARIDQLHA